MNNPYHRAAPEAVRCLVLNISIKHHANAWIVR